MGVTPTTIDEVAATLREASVSARTTMPHGAGTRSRRGYPIAADAALATTGLTRIVEHQPAELTATVEAGLRATDLANALRSAGQWWPQADIRPDSTVGGILATAASGRGRLRHGPVRDSLLEVVLVTGDGRIVTGGGRTVKGVAGYDLPRLAVGSHGAIGVIAQVTLKLWPLPQAHAWFAADGSLDERIALAERVRREQWRPAAILFTPGRVAIELVGTEADVTAPAGTAAATGPAEPEGAAVIDVGVPPAALGDLVRRFEEAGVDYVAEWGVGACTIAIGDAGEVLTWRAVALGLGGHAQVVDGPDGFRTDPWGGAPPGLAIMRRIVQAFDPAAILAPGRMMGLRS